MSLPPLARPSLLRPPVRPVRPAAVPEEAGDPRPMPPPYEPDMSMGDPDAAPAERAAPVRPVLRPHLRVPVAGMRPLAPAASRPSQPPGAPAPVRSTRAPGVPPGSQDPREVLERVFGFSSFRGFQEEVVDRAMGGQNSLVLMPTGGGKSITYQVPAVAMPGTAVVISPLVALMQNQVSALRVNGVAAAYLSSEQSQQEQAEIISDYRAGRLKVLYVTPERMNLEWFQRILHQGPLSLIAFDEAHCVSQWGHQFREDYLHVGDSCVQYDVPRLAVTATATGDILRDIIKRLHLDGAKTFVADFDRPNIEYTIVERDEGTKPQLLAFLEDHRGESGVVYCSSRDQTEEYAALLRANGYDALHFHANVDPAVKKASLDRFIAGDGVVVVATIAFGMGIDKPDVRFVAHTSLPGSIEAYYQETGRAGRDGAPAVAWMVSGAADAARLYERNDNNPGATEEGRRQGRTRIRDLMGMVEGAGCRRGAILRYFGQGHSGGCGNCDRCKNPVPTVDVSVEARKLFSAIRETGQRFGMSYVLDVLTGSATADVTRRGHEAIASFNAGASRPRRWWESVSRQMQALGLLARSPDGYGSILVSEEGRAFLEGSEPLMLVEPAPAKARRSKARGAAGGHSSRPVSLAAELPPERMELWNDLRLMRTRLASEARVPPYLIFNDATLVDIVSSRPLSHEALGRVSGIGAAKLAKYGVDILSIVRSHEKSSPTPDHIALPGFGFGR